MTATTVFRCEACGFETGRWLGFCPRCRASTALREVEGTGTGARRPAVALSSVRADEDGERLVGGVDEFDRVLGGGIVPGSVVLVGGEPGVGKSTLLLQVAAGVQASGRGVLLVSAEESVAQVARRAERLGLADRPLAVACEADVDAAIDLAKRAEAALLVIDSIQTVAVAESGAAAGSATQVREAGARLVAFAKASGTAVVLVGHVTKDGSIAGPKTLEHMVDAVLYLEGDLDRGLRFLRGVKNRFGSVDDVGVFSMEAEGLVPVADPSAALVGRRRPAVPGTVLFPTLDGRRSLLVELQALVVPAGPAPPRRSAKGIPVPRLHQLLAVLDRHAAGDLGRFDVYVSVVGGLRLVEPALDLPLAIAIASSRWDRPAGDLAAWGEVGLTGEVRGVRQADRRRAEATRLGVTRIIAPGGDVHRLEQALAAAGVAPAGG